MAANNMKRSLTMFKITVCLLLIFVMISFGVHYYVSNFISAGISNSKVVYHAHLEFDSLDSFREASLNMRVEELLRIKGSVSNELMDLEEKRHKMQKDIASITSHLDKIKFEQRSKESEMEKLQMSMEQAKLAQKEIVERNMPELTAPVRIYPRNDPKQLIKPLPSDQLSCNLESCFDYSRCSVTSGLPVYLYESSIVAEDILHALHSNVHATKDASIACIFVKVLSHYRVELTKEEKIELENGLHQLEYWRGDGRNHVLLNLGNEKGNANVLTGVDTGRAIIVQNSFTKSNYRFSFDVLSPSLSGVGRGQVWSFLPELLPARRHYLLSFAGVFQNASLDHVDSIIVTTLKGMQSGTTRDNFLFDFACKSEDSRMSQWHLEWAMCNGEYHRRSVLLNSTFSLIIAPADPSVLSTSLIQRRLSESLMHGAIPVILGQHIKLPFSEFIDWKTVVIQLPKARITELHFYLRSFVDADLLVMKQNGRAVCEKFLGTTKKIVDTVLASLRTRLNIPPPPVSETPAISVFDATFQPLKLDTVQTESEPEENVGAVEPPFPSVEYARNFSQSLYCDLLKSCDPFNLYPNTPWDPLLPTGAKFKGSQLGFRPIGNGIGGSGKEFMEVLGGNSPREQFTIVMLTFEREAVLMNALQRLSNLPYLNKVVVVWNSLKHPSKDLRWPDIAAKIHVVRTTKNSLNNRFLPFNAIETEAVLSMDDDAHLRHDEILFAFRVWRENRDRIVGFPARFHGYDVKQNSWMYNSNYSCELSMVLTGAAFIHKYYLFSYSNFMPNIIREKVDELMNCEDIAMNFLVSHVTKKPPIKVTSRWTFRCPGCPVALSIEDSHFYERHDCINFFAKVYGYNPLLYTQFRVDSVLFKTRLPHDKQKCFKFI